MPLFIARRSCSRAVPGWRTRRLAARLLRGVAAALIPAVLLGACASRPDPGERGCRVGAPGTDASAMFRVLDAGSFRAAESSAAMLARGAGDNQLSYLALSGGGAWGAFGAGYLQGWRDTAGALPEFNLVTGVSTGALIATFAFIGDPEPLKIYTRVSDADLLERRWLLTALFSDAFFDNDRLTKTVEEIIDQEVLEKVAAAVGDGRELKVGAVNLDTGEFVAIDIGGIARRYSEAKTGKEKDYFKEMYVDAVVASTAVPVAFEPSYLNCAMYVDGGASQQIFLDSTLRRLKAAGEEQARMAGRDSAPAPPRVYALVNGDTDLKLNGYGPGAGDGKAEPELIDIGARSLSVLLNSNLSSDISDICAVEAQTPISIISAGQLPDAELRRCLDRAGSEIFSQPFMQCLYELGEREGRKYQGENAPGEGCPPRMQL